MSTRGAYGFRLECLDYVQYNHGDSYPDGLGLEILKQAKTLAKRPVATLRRQVKNLILHDGKTPPTAYDIKRLAPFTNLGVGEQSTKDWYCLTRNLQGELIEHLKVGYIFDNRAFLTDSLFCEWAYILNLDIRQLECYIGFNKNPKADGRYAALFDTPRPGEDVKYYGVRLVATYPMGRLPSSVRFVKELTKADANR